LILRQIPGVDFQGDGERYSFSVGRNTNIPQGIYPPDIGKIKIDAFGTLPNDGLECRKIQSKDSFSRNGMTLGATPNGIFSNGHSGGVL